MIFKRKKEIEKTTDPTEERFDEMMNLVKHLSRADYNRLREAMDLGYNAYQKVKNVKTAEEKELAEIDESDQRLERAVEDLIA